MKRDSEPLSYVRAVHPQSKTIFRALVDSGNLSDVAISENLHITFGAGMTAAPNYKIGTAGDQPLTILGRSTPLQIYLENLSQPLTIRPLIIRNLSHELNLG